MWFWGRERGRENENTRAPTAEMLEKQRDGESQTGSEREEIQRTVKTRHTDTRDNQSTDRCRVRKREEEGRKGEVICV